MTEDKENLAYFWAKTTKEGKPGISVYDHMMNVGYVAQSIAGLSPEILDRFHLHSSLVGALSALHDLGKISPGFQRKCEAWLEEKGLKKIAHNGGWNGMEGDHGKVSHAAIQTFLSKTGIYRTSAKFVSAVLGAHHGHLNLPNDRGYQPGKSISEARSGIDWDAERMANARLIWDRFMGDSASFTLSEDSPSLWWIAGLASVADWIGSDERFFPPEGGRGDEDLSSLAWKALDAIGFRKVEFVPDLSFHDLFHDLKSPEIDWFPNDMQEKTVAAVSGPGVYVIEAPMGMGKTEAALWAAYQLLISGKATGIYFALPTQSTSNRMHIRMNEFVRRICRTSNASRLIHGNSWLMDQTAGLLPAATGRASARDDARIGRDWFASAKRALIAPFGVGTVDQALLGVVAARHFFVRHFALAGKVVILDEVHSYDLYTGTLIDKLITTLEELGCTVIVLSATLTGKRRSQIASYVHDCLENAEFPYPLISGRKEGDSIKPVAARPPATQMIKVDFISTEDATIEAITLARKGGAILWICNTVDDAQMQFRRLMNHSQKEFPLGLLHSRFPFWRREELENEWMERFGKDGATRCGSILVATQVVEQSVDLDADLLISELAPTDMLLQRLGRLWRHEREHRPVEAARLRIIEEEKSLEEFRNMDSKAIVKALGGKAKIYAPYILLRSLEVWKKAQSQVSTPSQIRQLIESTYEEGEDEPRSWQQLSDEWLGTDSAKKMIACRNTNLWQVALEDEEGVQTRINEIPTIALLLCRSFADNKALFIDGSPGHLDKDQYRLATAQAIHKNLVRIPEYCFDHDRMEPSSAIADYLFGAKSIGIVAENGAVKVKGLKKEIRLFYSDKLGLVIEKLS